LGGGDASTSNRPGKKGRMLKIQAAQGSNAVNR
jgi:hypothetical protein